MITRLFTIRKIKMTKNLSFLNAKKALLLNFTASSYHWGCYGTSMEIYQSLLEENYYVEIISVDFTHCTSPTVEKISDFDDQEFFKNFRQENLSLVQSIYHSDIIIVNGEGTLHRLGKGSLNLLYFMHISKKYFNKKIHLINFSCFPNGDESSPEGNTKIYPAIFCHLDTITPREKITNKILESSGIRAKQSFDCLPRFLSRHNYTNCHKPKGNILVTGGVHFNERRYKLLLNFIEFFLKKDVPVTFLLGAHFSPAQEDLMLQKRLKENPDLSSLRIAQAQSMEQWVDEFKTASFLFSARFHHSIAALSIGTPFRYLSSNTPKIPAALETIDENYNDFCIDENDGMALIDAAEKTLSKPTSISSEARVKRMLSLANVNFVNL